MRALIFVGLILFYPLNVMADIAIYKTSTSITFLGATSTAGATLRGYWVFDYFLGNLCTSAMTAIGAGVVNGKKIIVKEEVALAGGKCVITHSPNGSSSTVFYRAIDSGDDMYAEKLMDAVYSRGVNNKVYISPSVYGGVYVHDMPKKFTTIGRTIMNISSNLVVSESKGSAILDTKLSYQTNKNEESYANVVADIISKLQSQGYVLQE